MGTGDLSTLGLPAAGGAVIALTAFGALLASIDPALAGHTPPHPTLTGSVSDALGILQNNARVLAAPFLLALLGFPSSRAGRLAGDVLVALLVASSAIPVGLELGRWHARLLPYLPQLPLEWAALAVAISAWLAARENHAPARQLAAPAALTLALLILAAALETWATPHHTARPSISRLAVNRAREPVGVWVTGGCLRLILRRVAPIASRSQAPFPSLALGSARATRRCLASSTTRPPQGGIT
jgi:hypothetical protein